jgi:hypothetical protein
VPQVVACSWPESTVIAAGQEQQQPKDDKKSAENKATATTANQPKKGITTDDIKSSPFTGFGEVFYTNTGSINDCDANCFEQVHMMAHVTGEKNATWRRDVLEQLDAVRSDSEWQTYLHELYDAHRRVCQVTFDKLDELRRSGNARNMGPQEIAISEKYDAQMNSAQAELNAAVARQRKFAAKPYANSFAMVQGMRMQGGFCSQARVIYPQYSYGFGEFCDWSGDSKLRVES